MPVRRTDRRTDMPKRRADGANEKREREREREKQLLLRIKNAEMGGMHLEV